MGAQHGQTAGPHFCPVASTEQSHCSPERWAVPGILPIEHTLLHRMWSGAFSGTTSHSSCTRARKAAGGACAFGTAPCSGHFGETFPCTQGCFRAHTQLTASRNPKTGCQALCWPHPRVSVTLHFSFTLGMGECIVWQRNLCTGSFSPIKEALRTEETVGSWELAQELAEALRKRMTYRPDIPKMHNSPVAFLSATFCSAELTAITFHPLLQCNTEEPSGLPFTKVFSAVSSRARRRCGE